MTVSVILLRCASSFQKLYSMVYPRSVTELSYRFSPSAEGATIFLAFEVNKPGSDEVSVLVEQVRVAAGAVGRCNLPLLLLQLQMAGMVAMDLTTDELVSENFDFSPHARNQFFPPCAGEGPCTVTHSLWTACLSRDGRTQVHERWTRQSGSERKGVQVRVP